MLVFHFLRREGCLGEGDERIRIVHGDIGGYRGEPWRNVGRAPSGRHGRIETQSSSSSLKSSGSFKALEKHQTQYGAGGITAQFIVSKVPRSYPVCGRRDLNPGLCSFRITSLEG